MVEHFVDWYAKQITITGGFGNDRLIVNAYDYLDLLGLSANPMGGYNGNFSNGLPYEGVYFSGIEHFSFVDHVGWGQTIITGAGNDAVYAWAGNDVVHGGSGIDTLDGGAGDDRMGADLSELSVDVLIDLNTASFVQGREYRNFEAFLDLDTGSGNDRVLGHMTAILPDDISTGAGDDMITLWWRGGADTVDGGAGSDRLEVYGYGDLSLTSISANAAGGYNGRFSTGSATEGVQFFGIEHFAFVDNQGVRQSIITGDGNDFLLGGGGDDTLHGGKGIDTLDGGVGNDLLGADLSDLNVDAVLDLNVASFVQGRVYRNFEGFLDLVTGSGNDMVTGHRSVVNRNTISTGAGNDQVTLYWGGAYDVVDGGTGFDRLIVHGNSHLSLTNLSVNAMGGFDGQFWAGRAYEGVRFSGIEHFTFVDHASANNTITTGGGNDSLDGSNGDDRLAAGAGADTLIGGNGNDSLYGGDDNDRLRGGAGDDIIDGGQGFDVALFGVASTTMMVIDEGTALRVISTEGEDRLSGIESFVFTDRTLTLSQMQALAELVPSSPGNDTLIGTAGSDKLYGWAGHDSVWGAGGHDRLNGGAGNDTLGGGSGDDTLLGGSGNDGLWGAEGHDVLFGEDGNDTLGGGNGDDTLLGGIGDDGMWGASGHDRLEGDAGNDTLGGGGDNDTMLGGEGIDELWGSRGNDMLYGGADNDRLVAGPGFDRLWGGTGADQFDFWRGAGWNRLEDFSAPEGDTLALGRGLWAATHGELTADQVVSAFGSVNATGDAVLGFAAAGTTVVIVGAGTLDGIADSIVIL